MYNSLEPTAAASSTVAMPTPADRSLMQTISSRENTMNSYASASIGAFLVALEKRYLPDINSKIYASKEPEQKRKIIDEVYDLDIQAFERFIDENQGQLNLTEAQIKEIKEYLDPIFMGSMDSYDSVTMFIQGELITRSFSLKEVFALVFAATLDDSAYPKTDQPEKDKIDRVRVLINTIQGLIINSRCHQGIRHEICGVLNGVYPETHFIEDIDAFLQETIIRFLTEKLSKETPEKQLLIFKEWLNHDGEKVAAFFAAHNEEMCTILRDMCLKHFINPDDKGVVEKVKSVLAALIYLPAPLDIHKHAQAINTIVTSTNKTVAGKAEELIKAVTSFESIPQIILDLSQAEVIYQDGIKIKAALWGTEGAVIMQRLLELCEEYFENPTSQGFEKIIAARASLEPFLTEIDRDLINFVTNFFADFSLLENAPRAGMYMRLLAQKKKIELSDSSVHQMLHLSSSKDEQEKRKEISSYEISRVLLHAILVSPNDWRPEFYNLLFQVVEFIEKDGLHLAEGNVNRIGIVEATKEYLPQIKLTMQFFARKNVAAPAAIELPPINEMIMPLLPNLEGLQGETICGQYREEVYFLQKLYIFFNNSLVQFTSFPDDFLKKPISMLLQLVRIQNRMDFLNLLGIDFIRGKIQDGNELGRILRNVPQKNQMKFLNLLGMAFVRGKIKDGKELSLVLSSVHQKKLMKFLTLLDIDFVRGKIKDGKELSLVLEKGPQENQMDFLNLLDIDFVRGKIQNEYDLSLVLSSVSKENQMKFLKLLDIDFVRGKIKDGEELCLILRSVFQENQMKFLKLLDIDFVRGKIKDGEELCLVLGSVFQENRMDFLNLLGIDFVCRKIQNEYDLSSVLRCVYQGNQIAFLNLLGMEFVRGKIQNEYDLSLVLSSVSKENQMKFLNLLDIDFVRGKIQNAGNRFIPEQIQKFLQATDSSLNKAPVGQASMFQSPDQRQQPKALPSSNNLSSSQP